MPEVIVVGFDDKEPAKRALDRAIDEARKRNGHLAVIAVAELLLDPVAPRNFGTFDDGPVVRDLEPTPDVERALADARERIDAAGVKADYVWAAGDPARFILDLAKDRGATTIVLGSHHEGFFGHLFGLGVAEAVEQEAGCDVIVVQ